LLINKKSLTDFFNEARSAYTVDSILKVAPLHCFLRSHLEEANIQAQKTPCNS